MTPENLIGDVPSLTTNRLAIHMRDFPHQMHLETPLTG